MPNKMIIDASHPEETRVVVLRGNRVEEFDFEAASKKPLRGNIYLAKVTRVEPSLQAAFVDYGGNRHGFLAFSEIHPDYYQIPVADRQALIEEDARAHLEDEDEPNGERRSRRRRGPRPDRARDARRRGRGGLRGRGARRARGRGRRAERRLEPAAFEDAAEPFRTRGAKRRAARRSAARTDADCARRVRTGGRRFCRRGRGRSRGGGVRGDRAAGSGRRAVGGDAKTRWNPNPSQRRRLKSEADEPEAEADAFEAEASSEEAPVEDDDEAEPFGNVESIEPSRRRRTTTSRR